MHPSMKSNLSAFTEAIEAAGSSGSSCSSTWSQGMQFKAHAQTLGPVAEATNSAELLIAASDTQLQHSKLKAQQLAAGFMMPPQPEPQGSHPEEGSHSDPGRFNSSLDSSDVGPQAVAFISASELKPPRVPRLTSLPPLMPASLPPIHISPRQSNNLPAMPLGGLPPLLTPPEALAPAFPVPGPPDSSSLDLHQAAPELGSHAETSQLQAGTSALQPVSEPFSRMRNGGQVSDSGLPGDAVPLLQTSLPPLKYGLPSLRPPGFRDGSTDPPWPQDTHGNRASAGHVLHPLAQLPLGVHSLRIPQATANSQSTGEEPIALPGQATQLDATGDRGAEHCSITSTPVLDQTGTAIHLPVSGAPALPVLPALTNTGSLLQTSSAGLSQHESLAPNVTAPAAKNTLPDASSSQATDQPVPLRTLPQTPKQENNTSQAGRPAAATATASPTAFKRDGLRVSIHTVTFNMASILPSELPEQLFRFTDEGHDIYVVGTQETCSNIWDWEHLVLNHLDRREYSQVRVETLQAIHLALYVRKHLIPYVTDVKTSSVATGVGNVYGNKGGVAISLALYGIKLLLVCAHFAAHDEYVERRNADFHRICGKLFKPTAQPQESQQDQESLASLASKEFSTGPSMTSSISAVQSAAVTYGSPLQTAASAPAPQGTADAAELGDSLRPASTSQLPTHSSNTAPATPKAPAPHSPHRLAIATYASIRQHARSSPQLQLASVPVVDISGEGTGALRSGGFFSLCSNRSAVNCIPPLRAASLAATETMLQPKATLLAAHSDPEPPLLAAHSDAKSPLLAAHSEPTSPLAASSQTPLGAPHPVTVTPSSPVTRDLAAHSQHSLAAPSSPSSVTSAAAGRSSLRVPFSYSLVRAFQRGKTLLDQYDIVLWLGDLNYRINGTYEVVMHLIQRNMSEVLHANDQLRIQQKKGAVFQGFQEQDIHFAPTFKFIPGTEEYNPKRIPSWCDRVLFKVHPRAASLCHLQPTYYTSIMEVSSSDHKPVVAGFELEVLTQPDEPSTPAPQSRCVIS